MADFILLHARADGTFVISLNGYPYHVTLDDPLFGDVAAAYAADPSSVTPELPPETLPAPPPELPKNGLYGRMTDAELETLDYWLRNLATVRQRRRWDDATAIVTTDPDVIEVAVALYGAERAAVLLAPWT